MFLRFFLGIAARIKAGVEMIRPEEILEFVDAYHQGKDKGADSPVWDTFFDEETKAIYVKWLHEVAFYQADLRCVVKQMIRATDTIHDVITPAAGALAMFQYAGNLDKWRADAQAPDPFDNEDEELNDPRPDPRPTSKSNRRPGKFSKGVGKGRFRSGYTDDGMELYEKCREFFKALRKQSMFRTVFNPECREHFRTTDYYKAAIKRGEGYGKGTTRKSNRTVVDRRKAPKIDIEFARMIDGGEDYNISYDCTSSEGSGSDEGDGTGDEESSEEESGSEEDE